jgi:hypothetical protein
VQTDLVGKNCLCDDIAQHGRLGQRPAVAAECYVAERIETEGDGVAHGIVLIRLVRVAGASRRVMEANTSVSAKEKRDVSSESAR